MTQDKGEIPWAYGDVRALAAWIDSDGTIVIHRGRHAEMRSGWYYQAEVRVLGTDRRPLDWLAATFGGNVLPRCQTSPLSRLPMFVWSAGPVKEAVIQAVMPYLLVRRERAVLALEFWGTNDQERKAAIWKLAVRPIRSTIRAEVLHRAGGLPRFGPCAPVTAGLPSR